ncbi:MAG TPA: hypothetical protein VLH15_05990, partial [Dehalococcoidales bacterium]|nr:hypothetical protein [Dehalococcoidales bacterium]
MTLFGSFIRFPRFIIYTITFLLSLALLMPAAVVTGEGGEPSKTLWRFSLNNQTYINIEDVVSFDAGTNGGGGSPHNLALKSDGTVWAWGYNSQGELGNGGTSSTYNDTIHQVRGPGGSGYLTEITAVSAGNGFSLALDSNGVVWAWGGNYVGQLGLGNSGYDATGDNYITTPVQVTGLPAIKEISAG